VALEAERFGHGGDQHVARITGLDVQTIRRGRQELASNRNESPADRVRIPGAGRPRVEKKARRLNRRCLTWWSPRRPGIP
jgi:hypothetical protein